MSHGRNVNFSVIERAEDKEVVGIDRFRELKEKMGFGGFSSAYRIFLVPEVDRLTTSAANSILKLLEEPPSGWHFFLTSSDPTRIPMTILSRSQAIGLRPLPDSEVRSALQKMGVLPADLETLTVLSQGSISRGEEFLKIEVKEKIALFKAILEKDSESPPQLYEWLGNHSESTPLILDLIETVLLDLSFLAADFKSEGPRKLFHESLQPVYNAHLKKYPGLNRFISVLDRIQELRKIMRTSVNQKMVHQEMSLLLFQH